MFWIRVSNNRKKSFTESKIKLRWENVLKNRKKKESSLKWYRRTIPTGTEVENGGQRSEAGSGTENIAIVHAVPNLLCLLGGTNLEGPEWGHGRAATPKPFPWLTHPQPDFYSRKIEVIPFWVPAWADLTFSVSQQVVIIWVKVSPDCFISHCFVSYSNTSRVLEVLCWELCFISWLQFLLVIRH